MRLSNISNEAHDFSVPRLEDGRAPAVPLDAHRENVIQARRALELELRGLGAELARGAGAPWTGGL